MKQKDILLVVVVVIVAGVFGLMFSKLVISAPKNRQEKVEIVDAITPEFNKPKEDDKYLNAQAVDPTKLIKIGDNANPQPFNGTAN